MRHKPLNYHRGFHQTLKDAAWHIDNAVKAMEAARGDAKKPRNEHFAREEAARLRKVAKRIRHYENAKTKGEQ